MKVPFTIKDKTLVQKYSVKKAFDLQDGTYFLEISKRDKRTLTQNAFLHAILPDLVKGLQDIGYREVKTKEHAKRVIKNLFLKSIEKNELTGEEIPIVRDTSDLNKEEMGIFLDEVIQWAAQYLGIAIFSPNEQSAFKYE